MAKLIAFAGSARRESLNRRLVHAAAAMATAHGATVTLIELRDFPMPLYNGDIEESDGAPDSAARLYDLMKGQDGLLLACPEYNSSITPLLKNTIDWVSRPREGDPPLAAFTGKTAGLLSASPGQLGGMRGLVHVRSILGSIGLHVVPEQASVPRAHEAFDESGALRDSGVAGRVERVVKQLAETASRLSAS
ncbi:FMN-dependent NADPH-azoreductase [Posidoniimonas corsicana]|uniref:FMN-dependent NADPH-azoreductase n=1 Tax=Posidoniimonas corsicana TaxID=1938618 RepID=A0A5C5VDU8_9BACT|nr:NAD(P)H-dependent oxidoreductase [Posidoniimonas corsicana]TWT35845.1 FMN-dependent NADPH-azoreductase [Posidoniimonas corsicana]